MVEFTNEQYLELSKIVDITIANEYCHLNGEELKNAWLIEYGKSVYARAWLDGHDCAMKENEGALAEPVKQEPVAYMVKSEGFIYSLVNRISAAEEIVSMLRKDDQGAAIHPLYAAPVQQVDLTDDEIDGVMWIGGLTQKNIRKFARAVIAKFKEKNK